MISAARSSITDLWRPVATGTYRDLRRPPTRRAPTWVARTDFDPTRPAAVANPYADFERIRRHPLAINERLGVWMLGRYDDVRAAARDNETFSSRDGILIRSFVASNVLLADPPEHTRLRHIAAPMFTKRAVERFTADIRALAADGVSELRGGGVVDLVPALTVPLPICVIASVLGVPRRQWPGFRALSERFAQAFGPKSVSEMLRLFGANIEAYMQLRCFFDAELRQRAHEPADDLLTRLQQALASGELTDHEAFFYALVLLVAGNETTTNLLGILLLRLAEDPGLFARLKSDRALLPGAVEEAARWGAPVQWVTRTVSRPVDLHGTTVPRGAKVMLFYASANRDPAKFDDPSRFDIERDTTGHLAFGHGLHFCPGAHLARVEVVTAVDHLLDEVDGIELAGPPVWSTTPSLRGPVSLPVRLRTGRRLV